MEAVGWINSLPTSLVVRWFSDLPLLVLISLEIFSFDPRPVMMMMVMVPDGGRLWGDGWLPKSVNFRRNVSFQAVRMFRLLFCRWPRQGNKNFSIVGKIARETGSMQGSTEREREREPVENYRFKVKQLILEINCDYGPYRNQ